MTAVSEGSATSGVPVLAPTPATDDLQAKARQEKADAAAREALRDEGEIGRIRARREQARLEQEELELIEKQIAEHRAKEENAAKEDPGKAKTTQAKLADEKAKRQQEKDAAEREAQAKREADQKERDRQAKLADEKAKRQQEKDAAEKEAQAKREADQKERDRQAKLAEEKAKLEREKAASPAKPTPVVASNGNSKPAAPPEQQPSSKTAVPEPKPVPVVSARSRADLDAFDRNVLYPALYQRWNQPRGPAYQGRNFSVTVRLGVRADGTVVEKRIVKGSGQPAVDASVQAALDKLRRTSPLPASASGSHSQTFTFVLD